LTPLTWAARWQHWTIVAGEVFRSPSTAFFGVNPSFVYPVANFGSTEILYLLAPWRVG
jgi:hypothetical protein